MIDYVMGGEYLVVTSNKGAQPYINMSNTNPMIGALAFDAGSQSMKVFDGNNWLTVGGGSATVNLNANAISILNWAGQKMREEQELNELCTKHPAIKDLVYQMNSSIDSYRHKIEMVKLLLESSDNTVTQSS